MFQQKKNLKWIQRERKGKKLGLDKGAGKEAKGQMRKARQFVQRKNNKTTGQEEKTTENIVEVTDLQIKKVQGKEGKVSKF